MRWLNIGMGVEVTSWTDSRYDDKIISCTTLSFGFDDHDHLRTNLLSEQQHRQQRGQEWDGRWPREMQIQSRPLTWPEH